MEDHPNVTAIRRGYEAFVSGDVGSLERMVAGDVVWHSASPAGSDGVDECG